jgi:exosortase/archaeosortase family protein
MLIRRQIVRSFIEKCQQPTFWSHCLLFGLLGVALWPITIWFVQSANDQSRLLNALIVLSFATVLLVRFGGVTVERPLELNPAARRALYAAYAMLLLSYLLPNIPHLAWSNLLIIPAYCCALAAFTRFVFGEDTLRLTRTVAVTLCTFLVLSIFMGPMDWPLRTLAGKWSGYALDLLGQSTQLGLAAQTDGPPQLILLVNDYPFHVASECNGFGVILTSLLLALLLAIYRRLNFFDLCLNVFAGVIIGFIFNTLRIVIIVLLAPSLMEHYHIMHETVGTITYWACLILVWISLNGPTEPEQT